MARIQIKDLPTVTDLNAEELEEIFGAGKFSFKPAFESLGAREMLDAGIGGAFMSNMARMPDPGMPVAEQVRVVDTAPKFDAIDVRPVARSQAPVALAAQAGPAGAAVTQADVTKVTDEAWKLLKNEIIGGGNGNGQFANRWGLYKDGRESLVKTDVVGQEIRLTFSVYYRNVTTPAKVQLNFSGKFEGGVKTYTLAGAGLHDYENFLLGRAEAFEGVAKDLFRKSHSDGIRIDVYNPNANQFDYGKEAGRLQQQLTDYIKTRVGTELKSFTADVERTADGFILKGTFITKEVHPGQNYETNPNIRVWQSARFEFHMKFVGFADGKAQYVCVDTKDYVKLLERDGYKSRPSSEGSIAIWSMHGDHFNTSKKPAEMVSPAQVANQVFSDAQRVLSGQGYKGFKLEGHEFLADGVRVKFQAQAADGSLQTFAIDVKTEGLRNYRTVRATNNLNSVTTTDDQYNPVLSGLVRDVHGSWMWKQDAQAVLAQVRNDFKAVAESQNLGNLNNLVTKITYTEIPGGLRVTMDLDPHYEQFAQRPTSITFDIKYNGEVGTGFTCTGVNVSSLVGYRGLTAAAVDTFAKALQSGIGQSK